MESTSKSDLFQSLKDDKDIEEKPEMPILGFDDKTDEKDNFQDSTDDNRDDKDSGDDLDFMKGECGISSNDRKRKLDKQTRKEIEEEEREKML
jgi:hypothetical protein